MLVISHRFYFWVGKTLVPPQDGFHPTPGRIIDGSYKISFFINCLGSNSPRLALLGPINFDKMVLVLQGITNVLPQKVWYYCL